MHTWWLTGVKDLDLATGAHISSQDWDLLDLHENPSLGSSHNLLNYWPNGTIREATSALHRANSLWSQFYTVEQTNSNSFPWTNNKNKKRYNIKQQIKNGTIITQNKSPKYLFYAKQTKIVPALHRIKNSTGLTQSKTNLKQHHFYRDQTKKCISCPETALAFKKIKPKNSISFTHSKPKNSTSFAHILHATSLKTAPVQDKANLNVTVQT